MAHHRTRPKPRSPARRPSRPSTSGPSAKQRSNRRRQPPRMRWGLLAVAAAALGVTAMLLVTSRDTGRQTQQAGRQAPAFTLTATDGRRVALADYAGRSVLLYFSEGVGCDGCWYQMVDLEAHQGDLQRLGLTVLPVVLNDPAATRAEMRRFNLRTPFLTDPGGVVARTYDAVGDGSAMHANLPGHTFILIDPAGRITWRGEYPSMFVPTGQLLGTVRGLITPTATTAGQG